MPIVAQSVGYHFHQEAFVMVQLNQDQLRPVCHITIFTSRFAPNFDEGTYLEIGVSIHSEVSSTSSAT